MRDLAEILEVSKGIAEQAVAKLREEGLMCGHAQLARCLLKGLSLQEPTEIIQLIKYLLALFNLSRLPKGCVPLFSSGEQSKSGFCGVAEVSLVYSVKLVCRGELH